MVVREATPLRRGCQRLGKFQKGTTFSAHGGPQRRSSRGYAARPGVNDWRRSRPFSAPRRSGRSPASAAGRGPRLCRLPLPVGGGTGDAHHLGGLFHAESAEEAQLDQARLALVEDGELPERGVQVEQVGVGGGGPWF